MTTEELNALKDRAYKTAVEHGFHDEVKPDAFYLGLVMSEMGEAINADRKGLHADTKRFEENMAKIPFVNGFKDIKDSFEAHIKDSVEDEIADIVIRLLDFAGMKGYTLSIPGLCILPSIVVIREFEKNGLPGTLIQLIGPLDSSLNQHNTEKIIGIIIGVLNVCFDEMTGGSDCDLWWFVKQKMRYNELRPKLNGKLY